MEEIVDRRLGDEGVVEYLVLWKGYPQTGPVSVLDSVFEDTGSADVSRQLGSPSPIYKAQRPSCGRLRSGLFPRQLVLLLRAVKRTLTTVRVVPPLVLNPSVVVLLTRPAVM